MQSHIEEIREAGAQVLAVCIDSVEENARVVENLGLDFPILSDPDFMAIKPYSILHDGAMTASGTDNVARPAVFIIDGSGVVRWRRLTDNWRVRVRPEKILKQLSATR